MKRFFAALCFLLAGCAENYVMIPKTPAWRAPADPSPIPGLLVKLTAQNLVPNAVVSVSDASYICVNHEWATEMLDWSTGAAKMLGFTYTDNSRDCDKFTLALYVAMTDSAARAGVKLTPLVARLVVAQEHEFAAVAGEPGSRHELMGLYTDKPPYLWIAEPQSSGAPRLIPFADYPNQILSIIFGDFNP